MPAGEPEPHRLRWVADDDPRWDADRRRVFATVPEGVFPTERRAEGEPLTSDWWRVVDGDRVVGYGWLDDVWGDAEILLAVEEAARGTGVGAFALAHLEDEAAARGLNYVLNVVRDTHPRHDEVVAWFRAHGFEGAEDGRLRKRVRDRSGEAGQRAGSGSPRPAGEAGSVRYEQERERAAARPRPEGQDAVDVLLGPGAEESGGYADPEQHRY